MAIMTGSTPLALPGGMNSVNQQSAPTAPLTNTFAKLGKKPRKAPKPKKSAFGPSAYGAAFKK